MSEGAEGLGEDAVLDRFATACGGDDRSPTDAEIQAWAAMHPRHAWAIRRYGRDLQDFPPLPEDEHEKEVDDVMVHGIVALVSNLLGRPASEPADLRRGSRHGKNR